MPREPCCHEEPTTFAAGCRAHTVAYCVGGAGSPSCIMRAYARYLHYFSFR